MPRARFAPHLAGLLSLLCGVAQASESTTTLKGTAVIAGKDRPIAINLTCLPPQGKERLGPLTVQLAVTAFEALEPAFSFGAFEGPEGTRKPLSDLNAAGATGKATLRSAASGSIAVEPADTFTLTVSATGRDDARQRDALRGLAGILSAGPSTLTWVQASPRKGDAPFTATAAVSDADAVRIRTAASACLAKR